MFISLQNNQTIILRKLDLQDTELLIAYWHGLSDETKKRFAPHVFDNQTIISLHKDVNYQGYIAQEAHTSAIIGYAIIKIGYLEHDKSRLEAYYLSLSNTTDCTFAPSVADAWHGSGLGTVLFNFVMNEAKDKGIKRVILWGGVQKSNMRAIRFYQKNGFRILGQFLYQGENYDMIKEI
ncbi:MAG: GNAT family N-acetyltransferase [Thermoflexibacter sp.]|nr:GNAT family N-acetyltransferase [Thermoflexibacter sp.]